ncbi:GyrI-like domain-containing protein [Myxococcota bacterium]
MDPSPKSEYLARIHRAQDFIESRLAESLNLDQIARAAGFSPFHFHRVFSAVTGETLYQFILRIRLERAGCQLLQNPRKPITAIALDCGFSSSATFARAFRATYGMSASDWRSGRSLEFLDQSMCGRKNRKTLSKNGEATSFDGQYGERTDTGIQTSIGPVNERRILMPVKAQSVSVESLPALTVAYLRHVGPYAGDEQLFGRLFGQLCAWAGPRGLMGPETRRLTLYHDSPELTEAEKLRISVCVSVPPGTPPEGEVGVLTLDAGKYARAKFELNADEYPGAWRWFMAEWLPESGYVPDDRLCYELYLNDPEAHPERKCVVEITMPVKPL